ncbi:hypothetical protein KBT16_20610 [Nostoc sp. CCCryo 231-06]|nr:hypothetical protein [Nostoc sp. CCCryo 231-06]
MKVAFFNRQVGQKTNNTKILLRMNELEDTALPAAMRYILKAESYDRRGVRVKLYCIIAGSAVYRTILSIYLKQALMQTVCCASSTCCAWTRAQLVD